MYKAFSADGRKDYFIDEWKKLENLCGKIFKMSNDNPMDEIFTRYMYFERAKKGVKLSTLEGLRKFYEAGSYSLLTKHHERTFANLIALADFWNDVVKQDAVRFSDRVLRRLFVLNYAPNSMWTYITSVYFLQNRDSEGLLDDEKFYTFLNRITAFIWAFTILRPGVNLLRTPLFAEMFSIVQGKESVLSDYAFSLEELQNTLRVYGFTNNRPITRAMLAWFAFNNEKQELITPLELTFEIEHIYARNRTPTPANLEALGNKSLLESRINIRASDYRFQDKAKYYLGHVIVRGKNREKTKIYELQELAKTRNDFTEQDIAQRTDEIIDAFMAFIKANGLAKN